MKKIIITSIVFSSLVFGFSGGSKPKYVAVSNSTVKKVYNGAGGCKQYIYINMVVKGEKQNSKNYRKGLAETWLKFGDSSRQCGGNAYAENMTLGQVSYDNSNMFTTGVYNLRNKYSASVNFNDSSSSKSGGLIW